MQEKQEHLPPHFMWALAWMSVAPEDGWRWKVVQLCSFIAWWEFVGRYHGDTLLSLAGVGHLTGRGGSVRHTMQPGSLLCAGEGTHPQGRNWEGGGGNVPERGAGAEQEEGSLLTTCSYTHR